VVGMAARSVPQGAGWVTREPLTEHWLSRGVFLTRRPSST
jgi:hypothetical protein